MNQSHEGVRTAQAIINLALMTGNIGRPGTGANSITGQCNAMGSRLFSNTTNLLGGHDFADADAPATRSPASSASTPAASPTGPAWPTTRSSRASSPGEIKGLWVVATNTAHSWINQDRPARRARPARLPRRAGHVRHHRDRAAAPTSSCPPPAGARRRARSSTPSAASGVIKRVAPAPGQALADFSIFQLIADAWGCGDLFAEWTSPEAVFGILRRALGGPARATSPASTATRMIDERGRHPVAVPGGQSAPSVAATSAGCSRTAASTTPTAGPGSSFDEPRRRRRAAPTAVTRSSCSPAGAARSQWHTQTRTGEVGGAALARRRASPTSRSPPTTPPPAASPTATGSVVALRPGLDAGPGRRHAHRARRPGLRADALRRHQPSRPGPSFDPHSRQPSYKSGAVEVGGGRDPAIRTIAGRRPRRLVGDAGG